MLYIWRPLALFVSMALFAGALIAAPAFGQSEPAYHYVLEPAPPALLAAPAEADLAPAAPSSTLDQPSRRTFLPLLTRGPEFAILFGSTANPETFEVTQPNILFPNGITRLYVDARFTAIQGSRFRTEAILPDGVRLRGSNRTATRLVEVERYYLCRVPAFQLRCGANELPLLPGLYSVELFYNDEVLRVGQAEIR